MPVPTSTDPPANFSLKMPQSLVDEIRVAAQQNDRSVSAEVRLAIQAWLQTNVKPA